MQSSRVEYRGNGYFGKWSTDFELIVLETEQESCPICCAFTRKQSDRTSLCFPAVPTGVCRSTTSTTIFAVVVVGMLAALLMVYLGCKRSRKQTMEPNPRGSSQNRRTRTSIIDHARAGGGTGLEMEMQVGAQVAVATDGDLVIDHDVDNFATAVPIDFDATTFEGKDDGIDVTVAVDEVVSSAAM